MDILAARFSAGSCNHAREENELKTHPNGRADLRSLWTRWPDSNGTMHFRGDVYGCGKRLSLAREQLKIQNNQGKRYAQTHV